MRWDPQQYLRYSSERGRPYFDLLARVGCESPESVVDLGCGPGNLTATLLERWPAAAIEGIDSSAEMIAQADALATDRLTFSVGDVAEWTMPPDVDVIVSNALLQWVPGHRELLSAWAGQLRPGAWLAFQVPGNFAQPGHTLMRTLAESPRWSAQLSGVLRHHDAVATPEEYAELLLSAGLTVDAWETTYVHRLDGPDPVLEWLRGTGLRPVLAVLSAEDAAEFEASYAALLREAYPATPYGTLLPYRRIFAVASRP